MSPHKTTSEKAVGVGDQSEFFVKAGWQRSDPRLKIYLFLLYVHGRFPCMYSREPRAHQYLQRLEEGVKSFGMGATEGRESPCGCYELKLGPAL